MRNASLAIFLALFGIGMAFARLDAHAQPQNGSDVDLTLFWNKVKAAAQASGNTDPETHGIHWIFVYSTSAATVSPQVAQKERDFLRTFAQQKLYADSGATDMVSLVPFQLQVREEHVKRRLIAGKSGTTGSEIATYAPQQASEEKDSRGNLYDGGHDNENAINWALNPANGIVKPDERNFVLVLLGDADSSNIPGHTPGYRLFDKDHHAEYIQMLKARGVLDAGDSAATVKAAEEFKIIYQERDKTNTIYGSIYLPRALQASSFASPRTPNSIHHDNRDNNDNRDNKGNRDKGGDGSDILGYMALAALAALGMLGFFRYQREVKFKVGSDDLTLKYREKKIIYGPGTSGDVKEPGTTLPEKDFAGFPSGELATIRNIGGGKIRFDSSGICKVRKFGEEGEGAIFKCGETEGKLSLEPDKRPKKNVDIVVYK